MDDFDERLDAALAAMYADDELSPTTMLLRYPTWLYEQHVTADEVWAMRRSYRAARPPIVTLTPVGGVL